MEFFQPRKILSYPYEISFLPLLFRLAGSDEGVGLWF